MAYAPTRSLNGGMAEGMSDGKYKKVRPNAGNVAPYDATYENRRALDDTWYGVHESPVKVLGDGSVHVKDPDYVLTPEARLI